MKNLKQLLLRTVSGIEESPMPVSYFIFSFIFFVAIRIFFEIFSDHAGLGSQRFFHYTVYFISVLFSLGILFMAFTKKPHEKVFKVMFAASAVIVIAPVLDLLLSGGKGYNISYFMPGTHEGLLKRYFTFCGPAVPSGITPGIKIEIALIMLASFCYLLLNKVYFAKALAAVWAVYTVFFLYAMIPFIISWAGRSISLAPFRYSDVLISRFYLLLLLVLLALFLLIAEKKMFVTLLKDIRFPRIAHYELMFLAGYLLGRKYEKPAGPLPGEELFALLLISAAVFFACLFSLMSNNLADHDIDKISNPSRPLPEGTIDPEKYRKVSRIAGGLAVLYAASAGFPAFFFVALFMGNYFLYSMPPFRLKRIPVFSKLAVSLNSLILVMLGFVLAERELNSFPAALFPFFLIGVTLAANFIDLKDYEGDKAEGIRTLPVILGLKKAKVYTGIFFLLAYWGVYSLFRDRLLLLPAAALGLAQFIIINRRNYKERPVFIFYLLSAVLLLCYLQFRYFPNSF